MHPELRVALFDLDNTLYPASCGLMQCVDTRIGSFVQELLGLSTEEAAALRRRYFTLYGTTLRGLQHHHGVDSEAYLRYVHDIALESFIASDAELNRLLGELPLRKAIFTNAPREYAERVLGMLGIEHHFEALFDIRAQQFIAKPDSRAYQRVLQSMGVSGHECVMLEDTLANLYPARDLGMTTILITVNEVLRGRRRNGRPHAADFAVADVLAAVRLATRLALPQHKAA